MKLNENNKVWKKFTEKKEELAISDEENLIVISRLMSKLPERFPIPNQQNISENGGQMPLRDTSQCEIEKTVKIMDGDYWKNKFKRFEYVKSGREHSHKVGALASETLPDSRENENASNTENEEGSIFVKKNLHRDGATLNDEKETARIKSMRKCDEKSLEVNKIRRKTAVETSDNTLAGKTSFPKLKNILNFECIKPSAVLNKNDSNSDLNGQLVNNCSTNMSDSIKGTLSLGGTSISVSDDFNPNLVNNCSTIMSDSVKGTLSLRRTSGSEYLSSRLISLDLPIRKEGNLVKKEEILNERKEVIDNEDRLLELENKNDSGRKKEIIKEENHYERTKLEEENTNERKKERKKVNRNCEIQKVYHRKKDKTVEEEKKNN